MRTAPHLQRTQEEGTDQDVVHHRPCSVRRPRGRRIRPLGSFDLADLLIAPGTST